MAWQIQKELQKKYSLSDLPDLNELVSMVNECKEPRVKALFSILYLTGCRISEILAKKGTDFQGDFQGLTPKQVAFDYIEGKEVVYIRTPNRKNKNRTSKRQPIPLIKEKELYKFVYDYIKGKEPTRPIFDFGIRRARQLLLKHFKFNPHFIRHIRLSHLVIHYDFNEQALVRFAGWSDGRPSKHYIEMNDKVVFRAFFK